MDLLEFISGFNKYVVGFSHVPGHVLGNGAWELRHGPAFKKLMVQWELLYDVTIALMEGRGDMSSGRTVIN